MLSNNSYENSLKYLQRFEGFGGSNKIHNRNGSQERFVRMAYLINQLSEPDSGNIIKKAFEILKNVKQHDTQWSIVYDNKNLEIIFNLSGSKTQRKIKLNDLEFRLKETLFSEIKLVQKVEIQSMVNLIPYQKSYNNILSETVLAKMINQHLINKSL